MAENTSTEMTAMHQMRRPSRAVPLTILFVFLLLVFTLLKLPQARITSFIQGYVQSALDPMGIYLSDRGREISILKGFVYRLDHPTLELSDGTRIEMDEMVVSPSLLTLLKGKVGATMTMTQGTATIEFTGTGRGDQVDATIKLDQVDINKLGAFAYAGMKGSGTVSGNVHIDGSLNDLTTLNGAIQLKLKKLRFDEQNLMGFQLPTMNVSDGTVELSIDHGKVVAKNVAIGKGADDIQATLTGDMTLNRFVNGSSLNFRAVLGLSDKVKQSIAILDSILGPAKQADGKYAYKLTGSLGAPFPVPDPK